MWTNYLTMSFFIKFQNEQMKDLCKSNCMKYNVEICFKSISGSISQGFTLPYQLHIHKDLS